MHSLSWPNIFSSNGKDTLLLEDKEAIKTDLLLILNSERLTLFGDPYFGTALQQVIYQPNNNVLADLIIDELYETIRMYVPQVTVPRNAISIYSNGVDIGATLQVTYNKDNTSDLYNINLTNNKQEG